MLHIISGSPITLSVLQRIDHGDAILFIDSAVLMLGESSSMAEQLKLMTNNNKLYVLAEDLLIRGIQPESLIPGIAEVDFQGFVKLTEANTLIQSWH